MIFLLTEFAFRKKDAETRHRIMTGLLQPVKEGAFRASTIVALLNDRTNTAWLRESARFSLFLLEPESPAEVPECKYLDMCTLSDSE